jgi:hypothetical protein
MDLGKEKQMEWRGLDSPEDREMLWAVVSKVLNLWVPYEGSGDGMSCLARHTYTKVVTLVLFI